MRPTAFPSAKEEIPRSTNPQLRQFLVTFKASSDPLEEGSPAYNTPPLTAAQKQPGANPDGDGNPNILKFAINGNPVSGSDNGKIASLIQDPSTPSGNEQTLAIAEVMRRAQTRIDHPLLNE